MLLAVGPEGKRFPPLQGTHGLDGCSCYRDAVAGWLCRVVRFCFGQRCALFHPVALIYATNTCSERSMVRCARAFRSGKQGPRQYRESRVPSTNTGFGRALLLRLRVASHSRGSVVEYCLLFLRALPSVFDVSIAGGSRRPLGVCRIFRPRPACSHLAPFAPPAVLPGARPGPVVTRLVWTRAHW